MKSLFSSSEFFHCLHIYLKQTSSTLINQSKVEHKDVICLHLEVSQVYCRNLYCLEQRAATDRYRWQGQQDTRTNPHVLDGRGKDGQ